MGRAFQTEGGAGSGNKYVAFKEEQDGPCGWSKGVREKMVTGEARERGRALSGIASSLHIIFKVLERNCKILGRGATCLMHFNGKSEPQTTVMRPGRCCTRFRMVDPPQGWVSMGRAC